MEKKKISIIIPVYNREKSIRQCLESIFRQTIKEIEVICINDGSTDRSAEIIKAYCKKQDNIRLIEQENQGAGKSRNVGLDVACGKYISFLDADDFFFDEDALEKMVHMCERKKVKICGSYRKILDRNGIRETILINGEQELAKEKKVLEYCDYQMDYGYQSFIFSRELLEERHIRFPYYRRFQDPPFMVRAMCAAEKFMIADTSLYCYRIPNIMIRLNSKTVIDLIKGMNDNLVFATQNGLDILFENTLNRLEYEYGNIIYHNITDENTGILEELLRANKIVRKYYIDGGYVIRPLKKVLQGVVSENIGYEDKLKESLNAQGKIMIYGAGKIAGVFFSFLNKIGQVHKIKFFVVSEPDEGKMFHNIPVMSFQTLTDSAVKEKIYIATAGIYHKEIMESFMTAGIENYEVVDDAFLHGILAEEDYD